MIEQLQGLYGWYTDAMTTIFSIKYYASPMILSLVIVGSLFFALGILVAWMNFGISARRVRNAIKSTLDKLAMQASLSPTELRLTLLARTDFLPGKTYHFACDLQEQMGGGALYLWIETKNFAEHITLGNHVAIPLSPRRKMIKDLLTNKDAAQYLYFSVSPDGVMYEFIQSSKVGGEPNSLITDSSGRPMSPREASKVATGDKPA